MAEHIINGLKIRTTCVRPPVPTRAWDWQAVTDDYEPGQSIGEGPTELDAIDDLLQQQMPEAQDK